MHKYECVFGRRVDLGCDKVIDMTVLILPVLPHKQLTPSVRQALTAAAGGPGLFSRYT